jgi:tetratricopeptide (TPR) repeat protein/tRNA A-37 threonylcarbamoyl transferase component Bud32
MTDAFRTRLEQALAGTYTFERELGGGGMSRTYLARDDALARRVVVKVLAPELLEGLSVERFKREVLMAAQLQHPHVVPVLVSGDADGLPWFSMPYVDGESLRQRMLRGRMPLGEAISILRDVARALAYAHGHGIVHRDIKPDNVLLSAGSATVTDFGIAKAISASRTASGADATLTQAGMAIGTPAYMAPEQAAADPELDHRADLYAFGAMAYELLGGEPLFAGRTPARVLAAQLGEVPRDVREIAPDIPSELGALVMHCLAKDPDARPADAGAIVRAIDAIAASGSASAARGNAAPAAHTARLGAALVRWGGVTMAVLAATWGATELVGLPDWALRAAGGVMLAGLPALVGTWWVQRAAMRAATATPTRTPGGTMAPPGTMATFALKAQPHVSWTRTWRAGAAAIAALATLVGGYVTTRALGVGPAASLIGKGAFGERETIVVADFRPPADDTLIGTTVAEALRTDLAQSANLAVLTRASVRDILDRMQRPRESAVYFPLAREIATREGARAIVDGEIVRLGTSYVISARLVSALDAQELATFRETASGDAALVPAVGALSRSIRERVGESLRGIRRTSPLERVTTSSMPALRKYVESTQLVGEQGDEGRALQLLEEAVALDSTFAMAWRRLAVLLNNRGREPERARAAIETAMRFRDRLSDEERAFTEAYFYTRGPQPDYTRAAAAYEEVLRRDSTNSTALNNLSVLYSDLRRWKDARDALWRSITAPTVSGSNFTNLLLALVALRDTAGADSAAALFARRLPENSGLWEGEFSRQYVRGNTDSAVVQARQLARTARTSRQSVVANALMANWAAQRGRPLESLGYISRIREAQGDPSNPRGAAMSMTLDSAFNLAFWGDDAAAARAQLRRGIAPATVDSVSPSSRDWPLALGIAALVRDSVAARRAFDGFVRDGLARSPVRAYARARADATLALAVDDHDEAIVQFERAFAERGSIDPEEGFMVALAHDRAGRPDSAIAWYARSLEAPLDPFFDGVYRPAAKRRIAELLDAKGDLRGSIRYYEAFLDDWTMPEPAMEPIVRNARARLAALRARLAPG